MTVTVKFWSMFENFYLILRRNERMKSDEKYKKICK